MFQKHFNHVLVLTALVLMAYSVPAVRDTLSNANVGNSNGAAVVTSGVNLKVPCPIGLACIPIPPQPSGCPAGYLCTMSTTTLILQSVSWNNFGNNIPDTYLNPRVNFGGGDSVSFNDDITATEWCKHVPQKTYVSGTSHINSANPQDGLRFSFDGSKWVPHNGGDYPRYYQCVSAQSISVTSLSTSTAPVSTEITVYGNFPTNLSYVASLQSAIVGAPMNSPIATTLATDGKSLKFTIPAGFNIGNYTLTILSTTGSLRSSAVSFAVVAQSISVTSLSTSTAPVSTEITVYGNFPTNLSYVASLQSAIVGAPMNSPIATTLATDGKSLKFTIPAGFNIGNYTLTILSTTGSLRSSAVSFTIVTPSKKPFAWYTDENVALCWSAGTYETSNGCSVGHGLTYPSPNALNAGTVIGAKEYCAGLNSGDGRIWRLPNTQELMAGLDSTYGGDGVAATGQPGGFQAGKFYWTDTSFAITGGDANRMFIMSGSAGQSGASQQNILKNATAGSVQFASFPGVYARCVTGDYSAPVVTPTSAVSVSSPSVTYSALVANSSNSSTTQQFTYNFSLTAGNNPIYISKTVSSIFSVQGTAPVGLSMNPVVFSSNSVSTGDTSTYYYIAAGQTRAFSSTYQAMGTSGMVGNLYPLSIYYGTSSTAPMGNSLSLDTTLQNSLKAVVFH